MFCPYTESEHYGIVLLADDCVGTKEFRSSDRKGFVNNCVDFAIFNDYFVGLVVIMLFLGYMILVQYFLIVGLPLGKRFRW